MSKIEITNQVEAGVGDNTGFIILSSFVDGRPYIPYCAYNAGVFIASAPLNSVSASLTQEEYTNESIKTLILTFAAQTTDKEIIYPAWTDAIWSRSSTTKNMRMYGLSGELIRNFIPMATGMKPIIGITQLLRQPYLFLENGLYPFLPSIPVKPNTTYVYQGFNGLNVHRVDFSDGRMQYNIGEQYAVFTTGASDASVSLYFDKSTMTPTPANSELLVKMEVGNKPTSWSPAPEDMIAPSNCFFDAVTEEFFENIGAGQMEFTPKE